MRSLCLVPFFAAAIATTAPAQRPILTLLGTQPGAGYGAAIAAKQSPAALGPHDLVIGEPQRTTSGATHGGAVRLVSLRDGTTQSWYPSTFVEAQLGTSVAGLGDVDGDGVADFGAGAPQAGEQRGGLAVVLSGATGVPIFFRLGEGRSEFGTALCDAGDSNGDGRSEVAISAPFNSVRTPRGVIRTFDHFGLQVTQHVSSGSQSDFGRSLASIGDVTGDGKPDYAFGDPGRDFWGENSGLVGMRSIPAAGPPRILWENFIDQASGDRFGSEVAAIGDVDGDAIPDVLTADMRNRVSILSGRTGARIATVSSPEFVGPIRLAGIGDWDGDGRRDFAVGVPAANLGSGRVYVYASAPIQLLATLEGGALQLFGAALAGVGDVDGDGRDDLAIGAPGHVESGAMLGRVTVHAHDIVGSVQTYGSGCAGAVGTPFLYFGGRPRLGSNFVLRCGDVSPNRAGLWMLGLSSDPLASAPLPIDLQVLGNPGCSLLVMPLVNAAFVAGPAFAELQIAVPDEPQFAGWQLFVQALQFDAVRPGGFVTSDAAQLRIGNR